jgi:hypothetical protein
MLFIIMVCLTVGLAISQMNTLVMDVKDEGEDEGKIVHMWEQHDGDNQKWKLTEAKTGSVFQ